MEIKYLGESVGGHWHRSASRRRGPPASGRHPNRVPIPSLPRGASPWWPAMRLCQGRREGSEAPTEQDQGPLPGGRRHPRRA